MILHHHRPDIYDDRAVGALGSAYYVRMTCTTPLRLTGNTQQQPSAVQTCSRRVVPPPTTHSLFSLYFASPTIAHTQTQLWAAVSRSRPLLQATPFSSPDGDNSRQSLELQLLIVAIQCNKYFLIYIHYVSQIRFLV